jgi:multidrug resistance efflux pump
MPPTPQQQPDVPTIRANNSIVSVWQRMPFRCSIDAEASFEAALPGIAAAAAPRGDLDGAAHRVAVR